MADRYWVGGTGSWSSTSTVNWSAATGLSFTASRSLTTLTTVGSPALVAGMTVWNTTHTNIGTIVSGSGNTWVMNTSGTYASQSMSAATVGASAPTAADSVFFDANSNSSTTAFTVTMADTPRLCNDFTASGLDGVMTLAGTSIGLTVSGSLTFQATNFTRTYTGTTTFNATTTGKTVTTNGVSFTGSVDFNGVGGGWTLGSALSLGATVTLIVSNGTFDSGIYSISGLQISSSNSNTRTINLNSSTVTLGGSSPVNFTTSTGLTFNAGTSTINLSSASATFAGGSQTFYNVSFTSTALSALPSITGANTFNNLTITGRTTIGIAQLSISANQTINGTLTVSAGTAAAYRIMLRSDTVGTTRTLTCAAVSFTDTDFRDITIAGAASPASGTRLGDNKGNSGITFPAAKTVYYRQTGIANWGATGSGSWSATSGGALDATMFPLAQDTAIFPTLYPNSATAVTVNSDYPIGTIDMSLRTTNTMTLATSTFAPGLLGNWINGTGITISGTGTIYVLGRTTQTITSAGIAFTQSITISSPSGSVILQDALTTATTSTTTLTNGTLDLQSYTLSTGLFNSSQSTTRTIAFGTGQISCTGTGTVWTTATVTGLTTTGTQVVNVTSVGSTAITVTTGSLSEANSISFNFTGGTYGLDFLATAQTARNVDFTGYAGNWTGPSSAAITIYGNFKVSSGMTLSASANTMTFGATSGTQQITTNAKTINFPLTFNGVGGTFQLQDALTMGSTRTATLTNGTLDLNGQTLTVGTAFTTATGTKNLTFNGGTLVCPTAATTAFNNAVPTGFTTTAGTGTGVISMTSASAKTFVGGGSTFNCTLNQGGAGALTITGSNTFSDITNTVQPASVLFTAGTTSTFSNFSLSGTSGNLITIGSVTAASHTLSKVSGTVSVSFCSISRSDGTGGATWQAFTSNGNVDGGNNTGWSFVGVIYAAVIAETATATDAILGLAVFLSALAETATATDSPSVAASTFNAPVAETATATDSPSVAASTFNVPVSETATATDSDVGFILFPASIAETATATDSPSVAASTFNAPVTEAATATDSVLSFAAFYAALSETATATDSAVGYMLFPALIAETATATDAVLSFADFSAALAETATATDSPLVAPSTFNAPVAETATATDSPLVAPSTFNAPVSETVTISDLVLGAYLWNLIDDSQSVTWQNVNSSPGTTWSPINTDPNTGWTDIVQ